MANTATPAKSTTTGRVKPQARVMTSDRRFTVVLGFGAATETKTWAPGRKIKVVAVRIGNGSTAQAASTNTSAYLVEQWSNVTTAAKVGTTIATKAAGTALGANNWAAQTIVATSSTIPATNSVVITQTIVGTQGVSVVAIDYVELEVEADDATAF